MIDVSIIENGATEEVGSPPIGSVGDGAFVTGTVFVGSVVTGSEVVGAGVVVVSGSGSVGSWLTVTVVSAVDTSIIGLAVGDPVTGVGETGGGRGMPRLVHAAGIAEHSTNTGPGHSRSFTESLAQVNVLIAGISAGQVGMVLSLLSVASYSVRFNSELVSTSPYLDANVSNCGNGVYMQGISISSQFSGERKPKPNCPSPYDVKG